MEAGKEKERRKIKEMEEGVREIEGRKGRNTDGGKKGRKKEERQKV